MRHPLLVAVILFVCSAAFHMYFIGLDAFHTDEGLVLVASDDIARGRLLYRDCYVPVTPLVYLIQGVAFKVFGSSLLVSRLLMLATDAVTVALTFLIATSCTSTGVALIAASIVALLPLWTWPHGQFFSYSPLSVMFCVLALHFAWTVEESVGRVGRAIALGAALGIAVWVKPNLGLVTGFGVLLYWVSAWLRSLAGLGVTKTRSLSELVRDGFWTLVGLTSVSGPLVAYLLVTHTFGLMMQSLLALVDIYAGVPPDLFPTLLPLTSQSVALRVNPLLMIPGALNSALMFNPGFAYLLQYTAWIDLLVRIIYYFPIALQVAGLLYFGWRLWRRTWAAADDAALLVFLVTGALLLTVVPHPAIHYLIPAQIPGVVLACFLAARSWRARSHWLRVLGRGLSAVAFGGFVLLSAFILVVYVTAPREPVFSDVGTFWLSPVQAQPLNDLLSYTKAAVPAGGSVFAVPYYPLFYFISGLDHPTRFIDLRPGSPGPAAEDEMIADLEKQSIDVVLYFVGVQFPGGESFQDAYPRLHHYLMTHFALDRTIGTYFAPFVEIRRRNVPTTH